VLHPGRRIYTLIRTQSTYGIVTHGGHGLRSSARVQTYGEVLRDYETHPEAKCADAHGRPCSRRTVGLLQRRHIRAETLAFIGKESNLLEQAEAGLISDPQAAYTEYPDPTRDEWSSTILPMLRKRPVSRLMADSGLSRATIQAIRAGRRPHSKNAWRLALGVLLPHEIQSDWIRSGRRGRPKSTR
jgi:hypothetical protein